MMQRLCSVSGVAIAILLSTATARDTIRAAPSQPLFRYEEESLTEDELQRLIETTAVADDAHLFTFDDGSAVDPDRLKSGACKVFPGDSQWPSQSTWDTFDKLLGGALIKTVPLAAPCYHNLGVYDAEKCQAVRDSFSNQYTQ